MSFTGLLTDLFPPKPGFTEDDVPDLRGKVYIVTGGNTGVGKALIQILYAHHATVYMGARSEDKARAAMADVKQAAPDSAGSLTYLHLDLADLRTIKASADAFLARESMLHVLFNNAAVMNPPAGSRSVQGYELQLGVNNVGTYLFTKLLTPVLATTARSASVAAGSVRVVWVSSSAAEGLAPACGVPLDGLAPGPRDVGLVRYGISKAGNYFHATEFARRHRADGIVSVPLNPGNLDSDLYRHVPGLITFFLRRTVLYPSVYGAYTELFAGLAPEVTLEKSGSWVVPWGRFRGIRKELLAGSKPESEGGTGTAEAFWNWTEEQIQPYL